MLGRFTDSASFSSRRLFSVAQWSALLLGLLCGGTALWVVTHAAGAFSFAQHSRIIDRALVAVGWLLTLSVALLGIALLRFAFFRPDDETRTAKGAPGAVSTPQSRPARSTARSSEGLSVTAAGKGKA